MKSFDTALLTKKTGTWTTGGFFPFRKHPVTGLSMPVKTVMQKDKTLYPHVKRDPFGRAIYALPAGGEYIFT